MLALALILGATAADCDVGLSGPRRSVEALATEMRAQGLQVNASGPCRVRVELARSASEWTIRRLSDAPSLRTVRTLAEAAFVVLSWVFEDSAEPLWTPPHSEVPHGDPDPPPPQREPPAGSSPAREAPSPIEPVARVPRTVSRGTRERVWSIQSAFWVGLDDASTRWLGGTIDLRYRNRGFEGLFMVRAGTSDGARATPLATQTRRTSVDLLVGAGPVIQRGRLAIRPRLALGVGALSARRKDVEDACPQPGVCAPGSRQISDRFHAVQWVPKAMASAEVGWRLLDRLYLRLDVGATFAPPDDLVPNYAVEASTRIQRRLALEGVPWVVAHGGLGLALELP